MFKNKGYTKLRFFLFLLILITSLLSVTSCGKISALEPVYDENEITAEETSVENQTIEQKITEADTTTEKKILFKQNPAFDAWLELNPDVVGYIKIPNTNVDYPVLFNNDNSYYLNHDINGKEKKSGSVFMDMSNHGAILDKNTFLHGHNMKDGSMFHTLHKFKDKTFFEDNKTVYFSNLYSDMEFSVFAVEVISNEEAFIVTSFKNENTFLNYVLDLKSRAMYWDNEYDPSPDDILISLNTCSSEFEQAHTVVYAHLVKRYDYIQE